MYFRHAQEIWRDFPELVAGSIYLDGVSTTASVNDHIEPFVRIANERLNTSPESEFPEIKAWRRAFSRMGLKPTQYRCASEALLRRYRRDSELPGIHPLVDLCNAISLAFAIPIAAIDASRIVDGIEVRHASGDERYETFSEEVEHPSRGEVIFADGAGRAHARRWTNRQSGYSSVGNATTRVLIVAEAMHETAAADVERLIATISEELHAIWGTTPTRALLRREAPQFEF